MCIVLCVLCYVYVHLFVAYIIYFGVLLTVHLSIFISVINQLDGQNFCFIHVLIIRRSKLHYTASGIIIPIGVMIPETV